jgi:hypothetical protein
MPDLSTNAALLQNILENQKYIPKPNIAKFMVTFKSRNSSMILLNKIKLEEEWIQ